VRAGVGGTPATLLILAGAAAVVLLVFDPATADFFPPCLFRSLFGFQCPGCGSLRAAHQLLHGDLAAAWALNRTVFVALPLAALAGVIGVIRRSHRIG
jgi:hypothetical protein